MGLLNGLMPCGPLQTMQVYALGTGSFLAGALSMFLFSLGTVPLLLGFRRRQRVSQREVQPPHAQGERRAGHGAGPRHVQPRGEPLRRRPPAIAPAQGSSVAVARIVGGYQEVRTTVDSGDYHPFIVQKGIPVRWTVSAKAQDLNGCNNPLTVPLYGIRKQLVPGDNLIEFTPDRDGTISYTCWMGMITSYIKIVPDVRALTASDLAPGGPSTRAPRRAAPRRRMAGRSPQPLAQAAAVVAAE